jgi:hypothetical protein
MGRREVLKRIGAAPIAAGLAIHEARAERAHEHVARRGAASDAAARESGAAARRFFDEHEWATVSKLADMVIPGDARSGSATEAGVPAFIDFILTDDLGDPRENEEMQTAVRGGLFWLDRECRGRFSVAFVECTDAQRHAVLDDIAWPGRAREEMSQGVAFFNLFRDLVASGFWTSEMGMNDVGYMGNTFVAEWTGCPPAVLEKLGLPAPPKTEA